MRRISALVLALCLFILSACSPQQSNSTSSNSSFNSSSTQLPSTEIDYTSDSFWDSIPLQERLHNTETVEEISELKELHLELALKTRIAESFRGINTIKENGLSYPLYDSVLYNRGKWTTVNPNFLAVYLVYTYAAITQTFPYEKSGYGEDIAVPIKDLKMMASLLLCDTTLADKAELIFIPDHYHKDKDTFPVYDLAPFDNLNDDFQLGFKDYGNLRFVLVANFQNWNESMASEMRYVYQKEGDIYKLLHADFKSGDTDPAIPDNAIVWEDFELASCIIGTISNSCIALDEWDHVLTIKTVDPSTQKVTSSLNLPGILDNYRIKNNLLFLYFETEIYAVDENLNIIAQTKIPDFITSLRTRPTELNEIGYDTIYFHGYDTNSDFSLYAYSTEQGFFIYNPVTNESTLFYASTGESTEFTPYPSPYNIAFTQDDSRAYGILPSYEQPSSYIYYDFTLQTTGAINPPDYRLDEPDWHNVAREVITPRHANMGTYFNSLFYFGSPDFYLDNDFYYYSYSEHDEYVSKKGNLSDVNLEMASTYDVPENSRRVCALPDGQILFKMDSISKQKDLYLTLPVT